MSDTEIKDDRRYTNDHEWALTEGKNVRVGISAFAVSQLGDVTLVSLDVNPGQNIDAGKAFGTIESVKTLSDLFAPVSGTVVEVNGALEDRPELVNEDCYGKGWMVVIEATSPGDSLLDAAAYREVVAQADH
ncbi:MAG TPA: glycine cleavage system protein GcvH [Polyangiaceae bacterium]|jgi:glycine cleavage system H protein